MMPCSVSVLASSTRCLSSFRNRNTYTHWATIRPRYSGSCSQREAKIREGSGPSLGLPPAVAVCSDMRASVCLFLRGQAHHRRHGAGAQQGPAEVQRCGPGFGLADLDRTQVGHLLAGLELEEAGDDDAAGDQQQDADDEQGLAHG